VEALQLAGWRERVARLYLSDLDLAGFRAARDEIFGTHPQSAVDPADFTGLRYRDAGQCSALQGGGEGPR
jgi:hypothetical protein